MLPLLSIPAIYFYVYGQPIIEYVYDPKYMDAYLVTCIIMTNYIFTALFFPVGLTIQLKERMDIALTGKVIALFSLAAGILGMKYYGIEGVAAATIFGSLFKNGLMIYLMRGKAHMVFRFKEFKNYLFVFITIYLIFAQTKTWVTDIWTLLVFSGIFMVVSGILVIMFHPYNQSDLDMLAKVGHNSKIGRKLTPVILKIYNLKPKFR
jgi:O-antigen/teichoic acid export membrane protein